MSLEEWVNQNCRKLGEAIRIHLEMTIEKDCEEIDDIWRLIMISVRCHYADK